MGRKVLLAVVYCLTLTHTFGVRTHSSAVADNESSESAPRLYRNVPLGVYASAAPYGAYSFHLPTFAVVPQAAASKVIPVKENFVNHLTDSYGNKFVGTPHLTTYKIAFPQQYVSLQSKLPEHLAQPLVAASANFQFKQSNGQFFGNPYRVPVLQGPVPTPLHHFPTFGQLYGGNVKNFAPTAVPNKQTFGIVNAQQQSTNNKAVFTNTHSHEKVNNYNKPQAVKKEPQIIIGRPKGAQEIPHQPQGESKFQRIQEAAHTHDDSKFQKFQEVPHPTHTKVKSEVQSPQSSQEENYQEGHELPHYESKFQIIQEKPHTSQFQRIKEHHDPHKEVQFFQFVEEPSPTAPSPHTSERSHEKLQHTRQGENSQSSGNKDKLQLSPGKQRITYINDINGEKTIVELDSKPALPLLDLTLLEPLTFDQPIVPQVQHYLPRINEATYQKLPQAITPSVKNYQKEYVVEKTASYDSREAHDKPQNEASKKKLKKPTVTQNKYPKKNDIPKKTTVTYHETLDDAPEIVYEINSPNYKETVKQKAVSYNKQTQSKPTSHTYGSKSEKDPVTYSYSRTSKEPVHIMSIQYHGNGPPSPLIYNFKPGEQVREEKSHHSAPHHFQAENEHHSSHESDDGGAAYHSPPTEQYQEHPQPAGEHQEPSYKENDSYHKENENYHGENEGKQQEVVHESPPKYYSEPAQFVSENINFQPILKEYENNIRLLTVPSASIKVDPHQHVQHEPKSTPLPQAHANHGDEHSQPQPLHQLLHSSDGSQEHPHPSPDPQTHHHRSSPNSQSYNAPATHIHEKSKRIIIHEETPDEMHMLREQMRQEVTDREENSEEDFEKAYKDAAIGFPAYNQKSPDTEKDIFDPESYGVPRDHVEYDFENTPFQQYQEEGDDFPKEARSSYKDARDKMKQNYYTDYSISKPESMLDRYQNKLSYYKLFKDQKPDYLVDDDDKKKQNKKSAKFTVEPSFDFHSPQEKSKSYYGHTKPKQQLYKYDYPKGTPRDSSAFASRPYQSYKSRTSFVEPQFQYGFEPISIPKLLDSELAAMASNVSPESEKPGMRKKVFKENWYIKKTSTSARAPAS